MGICKDPALTFLNHQGYDVVRHPRGGIGPLDVLGPDGKSLESLGSLDQVWHSNIAPPSAKPPQPGAGIEGRKTADLDLSVGISLLDTVLEGRGVTEPKLKSAYQNAKTDPWKPLYLWTDHCPLSSASTYLSLKAIWIRSYLWRSQIRSCGTLTPILKSGALGNGRCT